jgi:TP901 family phage tail tape measure protein
MADETSVYSIDAQQAIQEIVRLERTVAGFDKTLKGISGTSINVTKRLDKFGKVVTTMATAFEAAAEDGRVFSGVVREINNNGVAVGQSISGSFKGAKLSLDQTRQEAEKLLATYAHFGKTEVELAKPVNIEGLGLDASSFSKKGFTELFNTLRKSSQDIQSKINSGAIKPFEFQAGIKLLDDKDFVGLIPQQVETSKLLEGTFNQLDRLTDGAFRSKEAARQLFAELAKGGKVVDFKDLDVLEKFVNTKTVPTENKSRVALKAQFAVMLEDLEKVRKSGALTEEQFNQVFDIFSKGPAKEVSATALAIRNELSKTIDKMVEMTGGGETLRKKLIQLAQAGKIKIDLGQVPDFSKILGATPTVIAGGAPKDVENYRKEYTKLIEIVARSKDLAPKDFEKIFAVFRGEAANDLIGSARTIEAQLTKVFTSLGKVSTGATATTGELKRLKLAKDALAKATSLPEDLTGIPDIRNFDRVLLPDVNIKAATAKEKEAYDQAHNSLIQHLLKNKKLVENILAEGPKTFVGRIELGKDLLPDEQAFVTLLDEAREAYNRVGFQAALTAATEVRGRKEAINAIRQSKTPLQDLIALQEKQKQIAASVVTRAVSERQVPNLPAGQQFDDTDLIRYYKNLATIQQVANSTTLSAKQLDNVFESVFDPAKIANFTSKAETALYTAISTFDSSFRKLQSIQSEVDPAFAGGKRQQQIVDIRADISQAQSQRVIRAQHQKLQDTFAESLRPINLPLDVDTTPVDASFRALRGTLESINPSAEQLRSALNAVRLGQVSDADGDIRRLGEAINGVLNAENNVRLASAQTAQEAISSTKKRIDITQHLVREMQKAEASVKFGLQAARDPAVVPQLATPLSADTPIQQVEAYNKALLNLDATVIRLAANDRDLAKAQSLIGRDLRTLDRTFDPKTGSLGADADVTEGHLELRQALVNIAQAHANATKAAEQSASRQLALKERLKKAEESYRLSIEKPKAREVLETALRPERPVVPTTLNSEKLFIGLEKAIANAGLVLDSLNLDAAETTQVFAALAGEGGASISQLSDRIKARLLPAIAAVDVEVDKLNTKIAKAEAPARKDTRRKNVAAILDKEVTATLPDDLSLDKKGQVTKALSGIIEKMSEASVTGKQFRAILESVKAGDQLLGLPPQLQAIFNDVNSLASLLDRLGASFRESGVTVKALSEPIKNLQTDLQIIRPTADQVERAFDFFKKGIGADKVDKDLVEIVSGMRKVEEEGRKLGLAYEDVTDAVLKSANEQVKANERIARSEELLRAERNRQGKIRRDKETQQVQETFPVVEQAFGKISPRIAGADLDVIRQKYVDLAQQMAKAGFTQEELNKSIARAKATLASGFGGRGGSGGKGFDLPGGAEFEDFNRKVLEVQKTLTEMGKAGSIAGKGIVISWQGVFRLFQAHVLHSVLSVIVSDFRQALAAAADFEKQIALIQTITTEADGSFRQWSNTLRDVADQIGKPSVEVAQAAYDALSNQVSTTTEDTARFVEVAGNFARITGSTTPDAVNLLSSAINAFGHTADDTEQIAASFFDTIDKGRIKATNLANTYGRTSAFAKALGLDYRDVNAAAVVLTQTGVSEADALTQINAVFSKLIKPTEETIKLFDELGVRSGAELITTFGGLGGALQELARQAAAGNIEFGETFNEVRSGRGGLTLAEDAARAFQQALKDVTGDASRFRDEIAKFDSVAPGVRLQKEFQQFRNFITDDLGREALQTIDQLTRQFGDLSDTLTKIVSTAVEAAKAFAAITVAQIALTAATRTWAITAVLAEAFTSGVSLADGLARVVYQMRLLAVSGKITGAIISRIAWPIGAFVIALGVWDQLIRKAAGSVHQIDQAFANAAKAAKDANRDILDSFNETTRKSVESVKKGIKEQIAENTKLVAETRKSLNVAGAGQAAISKDIAGRLESVFKSIADSFDSAIDKTRSKITELKKDVDTIKDTRIEIATEIDRKRFDVAVEAEPERKTELTLERVGVIEVQKAEAARQGDLEKINGLHKEEINLLDSLEVSATRLTNVYRKQRDTSLINQQVAQFRQPIDTSSIRKAQEQVNRVRQESIQRAGERADKSFSLIDLDDEKAALQNLVDTINDVRVKELTPQGSVAQMAKLNLEAQQLTRSLTAGNGQLLDGNAVLAFREKLSANHLAQLALIEGKRKGELQINEELLANQKFIADERNRYLDLLNKVDIRGAEGELFTPDKIKGAFEDIKNLQQQIVDIFKIEAQLDPNFDEAELKSQLERLDTEVNLKINSLQFEQTIAEQQQQLNEAQKGFTDLSNKAVTEIDRIVAKVNNLNETLAKIGPSQQVLARSLSERIANIAAWEIAEERARSGGLSAEGGDRIKAFQDINKEAEILADKVDKLARIDAVTAQVKDLESKIVDTSKVLDNQIKLQGELRKTTDPKEREEIESKIRRENKAFLEQIEIQRKLKQLRIEQEKVGADGAAQLALDIQRQTLDLQDSVKSTQIGNLTFKTGQTVDEAVNQAIEDSGKRVTIAAELEVKQSEISALSQVKADPIKFFEDNEIVKVTEEMTTLRNVATGALTYLEGKMHSSVIAAQELKDITTEVKAETEKIAPAARRVAADWGKSTKTMGQRFIELINTIKNGFAQVQAPDLTPKKTLEITQGGATLPARQLFGAELDAQAARPKLLEPGKLAEAVVPVQDQFIAKADEGSSAVDGIGVAFERLLVKATPFFEKLTTGFTLGELAINAYKENIGSIQFPNAINEIASDRGALSPTQPPIQQSGLLGQPINPIDEATKQANIAVDEYIRKINIADDYRISQIVSLQAIAGLTQTTQAVDGLNMKTRSVSPAISTLGFNFQSLPGQVTPSLDSIKIKIDSITTAINAASSAAANFRMPAAGAEVPAEGLQRGGRVGYFATGGMVPVMTTPGERFISPEITSKFYTQLMQMNKGIKPQFFGTGGFVRRGTDTKPGFLPAGSFVMNKRSSMIFGSILDQLMKGETPVTYYQTGGQVYAPRQISRPVNNTVSKSSHTTIGDINVTVQAQTTDPNGLARQIGKAISRDVRLGRTRL